MFYYNKNCKRIEWINGKYLLLKYNCTGNTEIENINPNLNIGIIFS